jgi:hypothetical protein
MWIGSNKLRTFCLGIITFCILILLLLKSITSQVADHADELSLFNPVYMLLHYGRLVYPAHGYFDCMVVHPPLHYLTIAFFYKFTSNIVFARSLVYLPPFLILLFTLFKVKLSFPWKFAFVGSVFTTLYVLDYYYGTRPTLCLALYWFNGWILIEAAKQNSWKTCYLIIGSFLIGLASVLHYSAAFSAVGLAAYLWLLYTTTERSFFFKKSIQLIVPALLVIVLYMALNILPNLRNVVHAISSAPGTGSIIDNMKQHLLLFGFIPPFVIAFLLLVIQKNTRHLAVATLPVPLFIFLLVYQKFDYFLPETFLLAFAIFLLPGFRHLRLFYIAATALIALNTTNYWKENKAILNNNLIKYPVNDVARACAKLIVGNNARIGSRMDNWYISGSADWLNILPDLYWQDSVTAEILNKYVKSVDYLVDAAPMCNNTSNKAQETLPVWYLQGRLRLHSFFIHQNNISTSQLFFVDSNMKNSLTGYILSAEGELERFSPKQQGGFILTVFTMPYHNIGDLRNLPQTAKSTAFALPNKKIARIKQLDADVESGLIICLSTQKEWREEISKIQGIRIVDSASGALSSISLDTLIYSLHKTDKPIKFYQDLEHWQHGNPYYTQKER